MIRPPPRSTLFPYTPLSRSIGAPTAPPPPRRAIRPPRVPRVFRRHAESKQAMGFRGFMFRGVTKRSEEHTSELQSHLNIVCRLLLEKKKITKYNINTYLDT